MKTKSPYLVDPDQRVRLSRVSAGEHGDFKDAEQARPVLARYLERLGTMQEVLYAGEQRAVLIVLQGMDTAGKDGTIRHIFSGINPQGCDVTSFKVPTGLEARHDFLWRAHNAVPPRGMIGIFNRSHYEDVLSPRVHKVISRKVARERMAEINRFEELLYENSVVILKFFLHISKKEQDERLRERIDDPDKHWKLSEADFHERRFWPAYQEAYEDLLNETSREHAPWYVIPSNRKWYRNVAISKILVEAVESLRLKYPKGSYDAKTMTL